MGESDRMLPSCSFVDVDPPSLVEALAYLLEEDIGSFTKIKLGLLWRL
jgi:hypothetical protein